MSIMVFHPVEGETRTHGVQPSYSKTVLVLGVDSSEAAIALALQDTHFRVGRLWRQELSASALGPDAWRVEVVYGPRPTGRISYSFTVGSRTVHITQSLRTVERAGNWSDYQGAIGVERRQNEIAVRGVDILAPQARVSISYPADPSMVASPVFVQRIFPFVATVNAGWFYGFPPGTLLFTGVTGTATAGDSAEGEVSYEFAYEPNLENLQVGPFTVKLKRGHDVLWVEYADLVLGQVHPVLKQPWAAYVEQVYRYVNFSLLGI